MKWENDDQRLAGSSEISSTKEKGQRSDLPELPPLCSAVSFRPAVHNLYQQRTETAALRDLFYSRARLNRHSSSKQLNSGNKGLVNCHTDQARKMHDDDDDDDVDDDDGDYNSQHHVSTTKTRTFRFPHVRDGHSDDGRADHASWYRRQRGSQTDNFPSIKASAQYYDNTRNSSRLFPRRRLSQPTTSPKGAPSLKPPRRHQVVMTSERHSDVRQGARQVAATGRGQKTAAAAAAAAATGTCSPASFRALTQPWCRPLPQLLELLDARGSSSKTSASCPVRPPSGTRSLQAWQNEIVKVVPTRPGFVLPIRTEDGSRVQQPSTYPYRTLSLHPATHFYRSWSKITTKDYVIHPEWPSEKRLKTT